MKTILVVDDERVLRQLYRDAFEDEGYSVLEAPEAETALCLLRAAPVDLAVLDIRMPGMNGLELLAHIHRAWPKLPVILSSGLAKLFDEYAVWEATSQIAGLFSKPLEMQALLACVRRALGPGRDCPREALATDSADEKNAIGLPGL